MFYLEHLGWDSNTSFYFKNKMGKTLSLSLGLQKVGSRFMSYFQDLDLFLLRLIGYFPIFFVRKFFYQIAGVKIGHGSHLHMGVQFFNPSGVQIGEGTIIGQNAFLDGRDSLKIGSFVDIASDVMIYNSEHDIHSEDFRAVVAPVEIGDFVFIGPRVIVLPGVSIGKGAVVAAGAVVTKDVVDFDIAGGVPARVIGTREVQDLHYKLGRSRLFQ